MHSHSTADGGHNQKEKVEKVKESEGAEFCGASVCRTRQPHTPILNYINYTLERAFRDNGQLEQEPPYTRVGQRVDTWGTSHHRLCPVRSHHEQCKAPVGFHPDTPLRPRTPPPILSSDPSGQPICARGSSLPPPEGEGGFNEILGPGVWGAKEGRRPTTHHQPEGPQQVFQQRQVQDGQLGNATQCPEKPGPPVRPHPGSQVLVSPLGKYIRRAGDG